MADPFSLFLWFLVVLSLAAFIAISTDYSTLMLAMILVITIITGAIISFQFNRDATDIIKSFNSLLPQFSAVIRDGNLKTINSENLVPGDIIMIKPGEKIPADMRILDSFSMKVDKSMLTG